MLTYSWESPYPVLQHIVWIDIGEQVLVMGPIISLCVRLSAVSLLELCEWSLGHGVL